MGIHEMCKLVEKMVNEHWQVSFSLRFKLNLFDSYMLRSHQS